MNTKRALKIIHEVANMFDCAAFVNRERVQLMLKKLPEDEVVTVLGAYVGLSERELTEGTNLLPSRIYERYPVFTLRSEWGFAELMAGKNGPAHLLKAIFGDMAITNAPTKEEEEKAMLESVRARCDAKVLQINAMFPNTYPLHLPVHRFYISTDTFVSFEQVEALCDSFDQVVARFSELFFADVKADLPDDKALEFNLLATFLGATDVLQPAERVCHSYIQKYRQLLQNENYASITDYVRIHRNIPVWRAREFYSNRGFAINYIQKHPDCKRVVREFLQKVTSYECRYMFINNAEAHERCQNRPEDMEEWTEDDWSSFDAEDDWDYSDDYDVNTSAPYIDSEEIIIPKNKDEISEDDRLLAEYGRIIVGSKRNGGADTHVRGNSWSLERIQQRALIKHNYEKMNQTISNTEREAGENRE